VKLIQVYEMDFISGLEEEEGVTEPEEEWYNVHYAAHLRLMND
jgi:hypothetical protein